MKVLKKYRYEDWVYRGPEGISRPFQGLDEYLTKYVNDQRKGKKQLTNLAETFSVLEGDIEELISSSDLGNVMKHPSL